MKKLELLGYCDHDVLDCGVFKAVDVLFIIVVAVVIDPCGGYSALLLTRLESVRSPHVILLPVNAVCNAIFLVRAAPTAD